MAHVFLTSTFVGGECSTLLHGRFTPGESVPSTHETEGWVGPRTGLDALEKSKILPLPVVEL
jgi:hypothetical protein